MDEISTTRIKKSKNAYKLVDIIITIGLIYVSPFKRGESNGFNGPLFKVPNVGQHRRVTGTYLLDLREQGHAEIHPASQVS